ncbi:ubiquitin activating enzyme [Trypanosoma grayi]|uniref:ubiquitin activating enzyme n=1 Tax=Trypanosoma grayi TaxID=71804 RepID=UPI0004F44F02|nr:ubiquitin activating enzyme [Trypanosoma grayi]KEG08269.1 ubiquitin activating enzyme [Trypanosoma grayi]
MDTKYDRQLRLWGRDGQQALAESHVVVLGATVAAAEMLKNMILPGIGLFTIVDDALVDDEAMGNNFFVTMDDYAARRPIAVALVQNLGKLNAQSRGIACVRPCASWLESFLSPTASPSSTIASQSGEQQPTLIVATPRLSPASLRRLAAHLKRVSGIPLLYVKASGLAGLLHIQARERIIIHAEPKPETRVTDLRIFNPFPALQEWFEAHDPADGALYSRDIELHSHFPWIAILYHALQRVRLGRGDPAFVPRSKADYDVLKHAVSSFILRPFPPQEGFVEALEMCRTVLNRPSVLPEGLQQLLRDTRADTPLCMHQWPQQDPEEKNTILCWSVVHGIKQFIANHDGVPPFCGYVPDFTTTTQWYAELGAIYAKKTEEDCVAVWEYAMEALGSCGCGSDVPVIVDASEVAEVTKALVQNLWTLQTVSFHPGLDENVCDALSQKRFNHYLSDCSTDEERFTVEMYAALLAAQCFEERYGRPAGYASEQSTDADAIWESDGKELLQIVTASRYGEPCNNVDLLSKACMEVARYGAGEPAAIASIIGAAAAQECIKLVQQRRVPIQRPLVFDGYRSCFWLAPPLPEIAVEQQ